MLGVYDNFPPNIHRIESFTTTLSSKKLQQRLISVLGEINRKHFSFEDVAYPTVPECTIIFEVGLAEAKSFNFIDEEEAEKILSVLRKSPFRMVDFFCAVRYYKGIKAKIPLKFDYFMLRVLFGKNTAEMQVFHERGPRYLSPEDVVTFLVSMINATSRRKILKKIESA
jgi:hypothetical protein